MKNTIGSLIKPDITHDSKKFLESKVALCNKISLAIALGVGLPFSVISSIYFPSLTAIPVSGTFISLSVLLINKAGFINLGRMIISLLPLILASAFNAGLTMQGEPPVYGIMMIQLSFSFVPFLVFDLREKQYLIVMIIAVLAILMFFDTYNAWLEIPLDTKIIRTGWLAQASKFISLFIGLACVYILLLQVRESEGKSEQLLAEAMESKEEMATAKQETENNLKKLEEARETERKRQWITEGLADVASLARKHNDIDAFATHLLPFLVRYMKASQGGVFQVNSEDEQIEMLSAYAYERRKYINKTLAFGEGLVGQAYLEKTYIHLTEIPPDYINITSGLGKALPGSIIIVPLQVEDEVEGILELASFQRFEQHHIEFLEKLGEVVATHLRNARSGKKVQELLAVAQQREEELRAQEEEMRQNLEELSATQEEMGRKEKEYLAQIETLKSEAGIS